MSSVFIKPLGIVVPAEYVEVFSVTSELKRMYELVQSDGTTMGDLHVRTKAVLTCGVTLVLPTELLQAANDATTLNAIIEKREAEDRKVVVEDEEKPHRGRRGRRAKAVVEEDDEEEIAEEVVTPSSKAFFLPAMQYNYLMEEVPLLDSNAMGMFPAKHVPKINERVGRFNNLRKRIEELRGNLRAPSVDSLESSLSGFGEEGKIDGEGLNNYENGLRAQLNKYETMLRDEIEWFRETFVGGANKRSLSKSAVMKTDDIKFGDQVIKREEVLKSINSEIFDRTSFAN